jgi:hypothetical protein
VTTNGSPAKTQGRIIGTLVGVSAKYPSMRIGQIVSNAASLGGYEADPFYVPDEELLAGLTVLLEQGPDA